MIALAIIAIALSAAVRAASFGTDTALDLKVRTLASWVAQNRIAEAMTGADWPAIGTYTGVEMQAGVGFVWQEKISATPNPIFRRIEIDTFNQANRQHRLNRLISYLMQPMVSQ